MSTRNLVEISLSNLDDDVTQAVVNLFDRWGRGRAVVEHIVGDDAGLAPCSTVKTYLLTEDDDALRQIEIGLALLNQARNASPCGDFAPSGDFGGARRVLEPRMRFLAETDWAEAWKAGYDVLRIGRRLVVKPTWRDYTPGPGDLVIELDPGMAFGSGLHPTTRLCLEAMEDHLSAGQSVLDVGTGSGILAIAAARLGASHVLALDTDPLAVKIARENVALNRVESVVRVELGTVEISNRQISEAARQQISKSADYKSQIPNARYPIPNIQYPIFHLVVANILAETIVELTPALAANLSAGGILIASGIISDRANTVIASLRKNGLSLTERRDDGEWMAFISTSNL